MFGVDMPPDPPDGEEFVARGRTMAEIEEKMGMPVIYLSPESMLRGFEKSGIDRDRLCTYCIGGSHPYSRCGNVELTAQPQSNQLEMVMAK